MLNFGQKIRALSDKKKKNSNSCVVRKIIYSQSSARTYKLSQKMGK
jgi:hypothetical protein